MIMAANRDAMLYMYIVLHKALPTHTDSLEKFVFGCIKLKLLPVAHFTHILQHVHA